MHGYAQIARIVIQLNTSFTRSALGLNWRLPLALWAVLVAQAITASDAPATARTKVTPNGPIMQVRSSIEAGASIETCYGVLADFDRLAEFIPGMQSSEIVSRPDEPLLLRQVGQASAAFVDFEFDVTLAVTVEPPRRITFSRVAGNLEQMDGSWDIDGNDRYCRIKYRADIEPSFWVPPVIGPALMRRKVEKQIDGVRAEIARRADSAPR